jgi:hypothetical protein
MGYPWLDGLGNEARGLIPQRMNLTHLPIYIYRLDRENVASQKQCKPVIELVDQIGIQIDWVVTGVN